jgi:myo-inositol 2-dehydrogenase/D-chiro-inositol 1-dehydrogenase
VKVALIGAGRIGEMHARILAKTPGVDELLVADVDTQRARHVAEQNGGRAVPSNDEAIDQADAVVIAAGTDVHATLIEASIASKKPTFCEKPLARDLDETIRLARHVDASGVPFQLGFQRRFDPAYLEMRRLIESGELGRVYVVRLAGHDPFPAHEAYIAASGGIFRDFSVHDFDVVRWLTSQEVEEVYADGAVLGFPVFAKYDDVDTAVATLRLSGGTLAILSVGRHDPLGYDIRTEAFGSKDSVTIGLGRRTPMRSLEPDVPAPAGPAWSIFLDRFDDAYAGELAWFIRVAEGSAQSPCTANDGLQALRVAEAATRSLHEHRPVRLDEVAS